MSSRLPVKQREYLCLRSGALKIKLSNSWHRLPIVLDIQVLFCFMGGGQIFLTNTVGILTFAISGFSY